MWSGCALAPGNLLSCASRSCCTAATLLSISCISLSFSAVASLAAFSAWSICSSFSSRFSRSDFPRRGSSCWVCAVNGMMRNLKMTKNIPSCAHMSYFGACGCVPFASPASGSSHLCRPQCESLGLAGCCGMASTGTLTSPSFFPSVGPSPSILHWTLRKETLRAAGGQPWQTR